MDIVSHALFGRILGQIDPNRRLGRGSGAAFVIGALAPDVDFVKVLSGWDQYLQLHQSGTHTIAASPLLALAVALTVRAVVGREARLGRLWWVAWASVLLGHLGFDLVSGSDMRLLAPFVDVRLTPHWLAMADLLAVLVLVVGTAWSVKHARTAALSTCGALLVLVIFKAQTQHQALASFARADGADPPRVAAGAPEAVSGSLFAWDLYEREGDVLRAWRVDARTGRRTVRFERRFDLEAYGLSRAVHAPVVAAFLGMAHVPFPRFESVAGRRLLLWSDLRHCEASGCMQSFGIELGAGGDPRQQVIQVGPFEQSRAMPALTKSAP